jgi:hypothetical protein
VQLRFASEDEMIEEPIVASPSAVAVASVLHSLKEIVSIVMGLALTNCVLVLITHGRYTGVSALSALPLSSVLYSLVLILNIVRFYHGNLRHMDTLYGYSARTSAARTSAASTHGPAPLGGLGIDFIVVFLESIIFAVISFYASPRREFLLLFMILMAFDFIWNIVTQQESSEVRDLPHLQRWMLNNLLGVVVILVLYLEYKQHHKEVYLDLGAAMLAMNTLIDFAISWRFYFPSMINGSVATEQAVQAVSET